MGSVIAPYFVYSLMDTIRVAVMTGNQMSAFNNPTTILFIFYIILLLIISLIGLVILAYFIKKERFKASTTPFKNAFANFGMLLFIISSTIYILFRE